MPRKKKGSKPRKRDFKAEYRRRLELGARRGLTVQQSRGAHPKEKPAKRERLGKVARRVYTHRWEVGKQIVTQSHGDAYYRLKDSQSLPHGWKYNKRLKRYEREVSDLRVYRLTLDEVYDAEGTSRRLSSSAWRNWGDSIFSVRFLVSNLPYGNSVLKFGWTMPEFVEEREDLRYAIYDRLKDDEPDEGRRTLLVALALR